MQSPHDILAEEIEAIKRDLIAKHIELGMKASGKWIESVEANTKRLSGVILAQDYTEYLVHGRKPGKFPPIKVIEKWIIDKGIQPIDGNLKISTLAFLIARKIARVGTRYFQEGGTDLVESVITPARIQYIIQKVATFQIYRFTSDITGMFQKLAT